MFTKINTKKMLLVFLFVLVIVAFVGCKDKPTLTFNEVKITVVEGDEFTLYPTIENLEGTDLIFYSFDKEGIVSFSKNNSFKALKEGVVVITATLKGYSNIMVDIKVTVNKNVISPILVNEIIVSGKDKIAVGEETILTCTVKPNDASNKEVEWSTSDATIATVNQTGSVKALKEGTVTIKCAAKDGSNKYGEVTITVSKETKLVDEIVVSGKEELAVGEETILTCTVKPNEASNKEVEWSTSDATIATVNQTGSVTALKEGTVTIKCTAKDGSNKYGEITITVSKEIELVTYLYLEVDQDGYYAGKTYDLYYEVEPLEATGYAFSTSDETIATIDQTGKLTLLKAGKVTLFLKSTDGSNKESSETINVLNFPTTLDVQYEPIMDVTTFQKITYVLGPDKIVKGCTITSSDDTTIQIGENGTLFALKPGTAVVTLTAIENPELKKEITITINDMAIGGEVCIANAELKDVAKYSKYTYNGKQYIVGVSAFANINDCVKYTTQTVIVLKGTYQDPITIYKDNITIVGPNQNKEGFFEEREEEAIITGVITINSGVKGLTIKGLKFADEAKITSLVGSPVETQEERVYTTTDFLFANNYVDTKLSSGKGFIELNEANRNYSKNITIRGNFFTSNSTKITAVVYMDNNEGLFVDNNEFKNVESHCVAVYDTDKGYGMAGDLELTNNRFINVNNSAFWANYYQPNENGVPSIFVTDNYLENVSGQAALDFEASGATAVYDTIQFKFNEFKTVLKGIWLAKATDSLGTPGSFTYNKVTNDKPFTYVYRVQGSNVCHTNNTLGDCKYNIFFNADGTIMSDDLISVSSSGLFYGGTDVKGYNFQSLEEYNEACKNLKQVDFEYVVNSAWNGTENGTKLLALGLTWTFGKNAFATITDCVNALTDGGKVKVLAGNYAEKELVIQTNNITLLGANAGVNAKNVNRENETCIDFVFKVKSNVENFVIDGCQLEKGARVTLEDNTTGTTIQYCVLNGCTADGVIYIDGGTFVANNVRFIGNYSTNHAGNRVLHLNNVNGLEIIDNSITTSGSCYDLLNVQGYICGDVVVKNNTFAKSLQSFIYAKGVKGINFVCENNYISNVVNTIIDFRDMKDASGQAEFIINNNTFDNSGCGWCPIRIRTAGYVETNTINIEVYDNKFIESYYIEDGIYNFVENPSYSAQTDPFKKIYKIGMNYYVVNGQIITELNDACFAEAQIYFEPAYKEASELDSENYVGDVEFDYVVNQAWASSSTGDEVTIKDKSFIIGTTAFASLNECISSLTNGGNVYVCSGKYDEAITISCDNITLYGPNAFVNAKEINRENEAQLPNVFTVSEGVSNFTVNGFELSTSSQILMNDKANNITLAYCVLNGSGADGVMRVNNVSDVVYNVKFIGNYSNNYKGNRVLHLNNVTGLTATNNYIECSSSYDFLNVQGIISGRVFIANNTYIKSNQSFLYVKATNGINCTIKDNYVKDVLNTVIDFRDMKDPNGIGTYRIVGNTFETSGSGWCPIRIRTAGYQETNRISINVENNAFIDSYYEEDGIRSFVENPSFSSQSDPFKKIYKIGRNFYIVNGDVVTELTDAQFTNAAISIAKPYKTLAELPTEKKSEKVKVTSIKITNKIERLDAFATLQLQFSILPDDATNKKLAFVSSDPLVATISTAGLVTALKEGKTKIKAYCVEDSAIYDEFELTVIAKERLEMRYDGNAVGVVDDTLKIQTTKYGNNIVGDLTYLSSDESIATVDNTGLVTFKAPGLVKITAKLASLETSVSFTVIAKDAVMSDIIKAIIDGNNGFIYKGIVKYIGSDDGTADFPHEVNGSVNTYWFGSNPEVVRNMLSESAVNQEKRKMDSIEFIVIHDTGASGSTSTAWANSNWCTNPTNTGSSWQYTIGNDGIFQQIEDDMIAWHAGDGTSWGSSTTLYDTGVAYKGERPKVTVGDDGYFYVAGEKSLIKAPEGTKTINTLGLVVFKGSNGNYFIPTTHITSGYSNVIAARGGNLNGIGIETAVNAGSDLYLTWQMTAKHVAQLLIKHNLTPDRVWFHNNFSNKKCPNTMITADLVDEFLKLVYKEYEIAKNYSDYTIAFVSNNPDIIDNEGRVINVPEFTTNVSYTVTVKKGDATESITLNSVVLGKYN